jgi:predicted acylesterase/phospholipase RssA
VGLTLIRKSKGKGLRPGAKVALVLAGGAVSGGAFKVGGLKALNDFLVGRGIPDLDIYVGLSAGGLIAVPLAGGIPPDEMIQVLEGTSERFDQLRPIDFYGLNVREFALRPLKFGYDVLSYVPGVTADFLRSLPHLPDSVGKSARRFYHEPSYTHLETLVIRVLEATSPKREIPALTNHIPSGFFDNSGLERWLRRSLERIDIPNDFSSFRRRSGKDLYLCAANLDTAERVVFGHDEDDSVTISQAMQASTAMPIFYKPPRINGVDYIDGGVKHTANIDVAIDKGADLIICYNPFRPFINHPEEASSGGHYFADGKYLSDRGLKTVANQALRMMMHSRLKLGIQRYLADDRFQGDIVLLEPREHDASYFALNPLAFWKRAEAVQHGFESVRHTILQNYDELSEVFGRYGLELSPDTAAEKAEEIRAHHGWVGDDEEEQAPLRLVRHA